MQKLIPFKVSLGCYLVNNESVASSPSLEPQRDPVSAKACVVNDMAKAIS